MYDSIKKFHKGTFSLRAGPALLTGAWLAAGLGGPAGRAAEPSNRPAGLIKIPAGCFRLGSSRGFADERPAHRVCLDRYAIDQTEVTVAAYSRCVAAGRCRPPVAFAATHPVRRQCNWQRPGRARHPVNCVGWAAARAYCAWRGGRLPTEAEWERAARLASRGSRSRALFPWGRAPATCKRTRIARRRGHAVSPGCGQGGTAEVGRYPADRTPQGVVDLVGNVSEWVGDRFSRTYYKSSPGRNPNGPRRGRAHGVRGCSFACVPGSLLLRVTARQYGMTWDPTIGFRCVVGR